MRAAGPQAGGLARRWIFAALLLWAVLPICPVIQAADKDGSERQWLARRGLIISANFAVTRQELQLRKRLDALDALAKRVAQAHQLADAALAKNELIRAELRQVEAANPAAAQAKSPGAPDGKAAPERLNWRLPDVTGPGEQTPLQLALIEWTSARSALEVSVLEIQRTIEALDRDYQELAGDREVQQTIAAIGNLRLGPAKDYRHNHRLAVAKDVFTAAQPIYRESGRWRIGAVLNERIAATFSYAEPGQPTTIAATLAQVLELHSDAGVEKIRLADRDVAVRRATMPTLRLGKFVFHDVPVLLLPPEAEDLGSQLASGALAGCRVRLDPQRMSLELESVASSPRRGDEQVAESFPPKARKIQRRQ